MRFGFGDEFLFIDFTYSPFSIKYSKVVLSSTRNIKIIQTLLFLSFHVFFFFLTAKNIDTRNKGLDRCGATCDDKGQ